MIINTKRRARRRRGPGSGLQMSLNSRRFLQTMFAPYDFAQVGCSGVPDEFGGPSFVVMQRQLFTLTQSTTQDQYIVVSPSPQVAYWSHTRTAGTSLTSSAVFTGVAFADQSIFGGGDSAGPGEVANRIRVLGMTAEAKCTGALLSTTGVFSVARGDVGFETMSDPQTIAALGGQVSGNVSVVGPRSTANGITAASNYTGEFIKGFYSVARHMGPWTMAAPYDVNDDPGTTTISIPYYAPTSDDGPSDGVYQVSSVSIGSRFNWFDNNMESIFVKIPAVAANPATCTFEVIMTVEVSPAKNSAFAKIAAVSPEHDQAALDLYTHIAQSLPIAVPSAQNFNFWKLVVDIAKTAGSIASHVPGPIGWIGGGVRDIATGVDDLFVTKRRPPPFVSDFPLD